MERGARSFMDVKATVTLHLSIKPCIGTLIHRFQNTNQIIGRLFLQELVIYISKTSHLRRKIIKVYLLLKLDIMHYFKIYFSRCHLFVSSTIFFLYNRY